MKALLLPAILTTVIGVAAGGLFGWIMKDSAGLATVATEAASHGESKAGAGCQPGTEHEVVVALPALLSNLAGEPPRWVRLEASFVTPAGEAPITEGDRERLAQDIVALLRQTKSSEIEGAAGLQNLRSDVQELARIRSAGRSLEFVVRGLLIE